MVLTLGLKNDYKKMIIKRGKTYLLIDKQNKFNNKSINNFTLKDLEDKFLFFLSSDGNLIKVTFENALTNVFFFEEFKADKTTNYSYFKFEQAKLAIDQKLAK